jgi:hypothetical protein
MGALFPRLAIGASWNPVIFDGSAVVSMCYGDPDVSPPLVRVRFQPQAIPMHEIRQVASLTAPRSFIRSGYGLKLRFELIVAYETGFSFPSAPGSTAGADATLDAIASIMGHSAGSLTGTQGSSFPPYLFLTTTYQTLLEQWIPVEVDVDDTSDKSQPYLVKTYAREMSFNLTTRQTFARAVTAYALRPQMLIPTGTASIGAHGTGPPYAATITLTAPLDPSVTAPGGVILLLFNTYSWFVFQVTNVSSNRLTITANCQAPWPSSGSGITYRTLAPELGSAGQYIPQLFQMPYWVFTQFAGLAPVAGWTSALPSNVGIIGNQA